MPQLFILPNAFSVNSLGWRVSLQVKTIKITLLSGASSFPRKLPERTCAGNPPTQICVVGTDMASWVFGVCVCVCVRVKGNALSAYVNRCLNRRLIEQLKAEVRLVICFGSINAMFGLPWKVMSLSLWENIIFFNCFIKISAGVLLWIYIKYQLLWPFLKHLINKLMTWSYAYSRQWCAHTRL